MSAQDTAQLRPPSLSPAYARSGSPKRRRDFLAKTMGSFAQALENSLFAETIGQRAGLMQALDPRLKVVAAALLLLSVAMVRHPITLVGLYLAVLFLAATSHLPLGLLLKRVGLAVLLFTGALALPALFITPGRVLIPLASVHLAGLGPLSLVITEQGLRTAVLLVLRASVSVSLVTLLMLATPWPTLLKALRVLGVPQFFVLVLSTTHRYVFLLLHTANAMYLARESRRVGRLSGAENRRWVARAMGHLLIRSYHLSEEVYLAMLSRGFRGEVVGQGLAPLRWRSRDGWAGMAALALAVGALWLDFTLGWR